VNDQKDAEILRLKKLVTLNSSSDSLPTFSSSDLSQKDAEIVKLTSLLEMTENNSKILLSTKDDEIKKLISLQEINMNANIEKDNEITELKQLLEKNDIVEEQIVELQNLKNEIEGLKSQLQSITIDFNASIAENTTLKNDLYDLKHRKEELPLHIQDQEQQFLRISKEATQLAQVLQDKDLENQQLQILNQRLEGELAGVRSSLQALQLETDCVSNELNDLNNAFKSKDADIAELKRTNDSLSYSLQLETSQCDQLKDTIEKLESYNQQESKQIYDTVQLIRLMISRLSRKNVDELKEELIEDTNLFSLVSKLKDLIEDSDKTYNQKSMVVEYSSPTLTPAKGKTASIFTPISGTEKRGRVGAFISSPAAKEMSRLHAEISLERRRLHFLQEQHSDLLGLLAQQEVELSVFKDVLEESGGNKAVTYAEEESRRVTIEKYGYYTDFRQCTVEEDEVEANDDISPI
jgi:chromosome segregation ATPase